MEVYLLCDNRDMTDLWEMYFDGIKDVHIVYDDFNSFMENHKIECVVSPANSFGLMDGGYDAAITGWFGDELQKNVQEYIMDNFLGEQPVGSSFIIEIPQNGTKLIHTPTMRIPEKIIDSSVIYHCMRSCLITALKNNVKSIVIPAFGVGTGGVCLGDAAKLMWMAYMQIMCGNKEISWEYAVETHYRGLI